MIICNENSSQFHWLEEFVFSFWLKNRINDKDTLDSFYMDKADSIVKKYFKDFKEFSATWALKVTWENMTLFADRSEVT